jgi:CBS domain-containing protein
MKVRDVMSMIIEEISGDATCQEAARRMDGGNVGMLIVTREGRLIEGVLTDRDLVTRCVALGADPAEHRVDEYMDRHPTTVQGDLELERAVEIMRNTRHHRLPVTIAGNKVIGIISLDDVAVDVKHYADAFLAAAGQYSKRAP